MALRSRYGYRTPVPSVSAQKAQTRQLSYTGGVDTYTDNDDLKPNYLTYATDARMVQVGRYQTRRGATRFSVPVGEAVAGSVTAVTGADTQTVNGTTSAAQKLTPSATGGITRVDVNLRTTDSSVGSLLVELCSDASGAPGTVIGRSSIEASSVPGTFAYVPCYFMSAPDATTSTDIWVVIRGQNSSTGNYEISTTTSASTAATQTGDTTWEAQSFALNAKVYVAPLNPVKGVYRAYRSNGLRVTYMAAGDTVYTVDEVTGATTALKTGLDTSATAYRFDMAQDSTVWANEVEKPYKHDMAGGTVSELTDAPADATTVIEHKGLLFFGNAVDRSQQYYSNFGVYDEFTSTDFLTIMAPKSPYRHTAVAKLNGALYVFANKNKFVVYGDSNATWSLDEANDQRGTFSQESVAVNENYIFHADDDGVHQFNGTESQNLAKPFLNEYKAVPDKSTITLELYDNRLYIFYAPAGNPRNTECFVVNTLLGVYEGKDLGTYVGRTFARFTQDNVYLQGSNRVAALYYGETSNYDNLGDQLQFELRTAYSHFDSPAQFKRVPKWRPRFDSASLEYDVEVGYAYDGQTEAVWLDPIPLGADNSRYNTGLTFNSGVTYATPGAGVEPLGLYMSGEGKRIQRRVRHIAAHEPVTVDSEVMTIETQRLH